VKKRQVSIADYPSEDEGANPLPSHQPLQITLRQAVSDFDKNLSDRIIRTYHSYTPKTTRVGRYIDWLIYNGNTVIGVIGLMDTPALQLKTRDRFIGWTQKQQERHMRNIVANYRFTLMPNAPPNSASKVLSILIKICQREWFKKYKSPIYLIETVVKPPKQGTCYLASGWKLKGLTAGGEGTFHGLTFGGKTKTGGELRDLTFKKKRLLIFLKPLVPDFRRRLKK